MSYTCGYYGDKRDDLIDELKAVIERYGGKISAEDDQCPIVSIKGLGWFEFDDLIDEPEEVEESPAIIRARAIAKLTPLEQQVLGLLS